MRMTWEQLKHLPVVTRSGQALGVVTGFVFDPETHAILQYEVRRGLPLVSATLLVSATQVVGITAERMTVDDSVAKTTAEASAEKLPATEPSASGLTVTRKVS